MRKRIPFLSFFVLFSLLVPLSLSASDNEGFEREVRTLVNLLDYIGQDYAHAIKDGKVIDEFEYREMEEFAERVRERSASIDSVLEGKGEAALAFGSELDSLDTLIDRKSPHKKVYTLTSSLKKTVLERQLMKVSPRDVPDLSEGKRIYGRKCSRCHGKQGAGNGPDAKGMKPSPTNLRDHAYMMKVAPLKIFNTSRLGIEGTQMRAFDELSDEEVWEVAFYITSLRYQDRDQDSAMMVYERLEDPPSLKDAALSTDEALLQDHRPDKVDSSDFLAAVRLYQEKGSKDGGDAALEIASTRLEKALDAYEAGKKGKAKELAISAYLDGIEPIEERLSTKSQGLVDSLESAMFSVREGIKNGIPVGELQKRAADARASIDRSSMALSGKGTGYWTIFLITVSIILREGLEAFLIIVAILSVIRSMGLPKAALSVHAGWLLALGIGFISWFFADQLLEGIGMKRIEVMEGIGALTAVIILLFVGYWLHSKSEVSKWKDFVENRVKRLTNEGNLFGLALLAFVVVFREAFESVIFLSAIRIGAAEGAASAIPSATLLTLLAVLILAFIALRFSKRLPIPTLFKVSSVMLGVLAVILMGKGVHAFQESGHLTMTSFPFDLQLGFLGFYSTFESVIAQLLAIALCAFLWVQGNKPLQKPAA